MEWIKTNSTTIILIGLFLAYSLFNESQRKEIPNFVEQKQRVINIDSIVSVIEAKNRLAIDSAILRERKSIDSLKTIVRKDLNKYRSLEQEINDINHIIEPLPAF